MVFVNISELVEVTEEAADNALFYSEDLLWSINGGGPYNGAGLHGIDNNHAGDGTSGGGDDEVDGPPDPRINTTTINDGATGPVPSCFISNGNPAHSDARPAEAGDARGQGTLGLNTPRPIEVPSTGAAQCITVEEPRGDTISDNGREIDSMGAGHQTKDQTP